MFGHHQKTQENSFPIMQLANSSNNSMLLSQFVFSQQPRSRTPNNLVVGRRNNSRSFTRFIPGQHKGGSSVGMPYQSKQHCNSTKGEQFAVSQKFPQRSIPPYRQSLLLTKNSSVSAQRDSQFKSKLGLNSDINDLNVNSKPL